MNVGSWICRSLLLLVKVCIENVMYLNPGNLILAYSPGSQLSICQVNQSAAVCDRQYWLVGRWLQENFDR